MRFLLPVLFLIQPLCAQEADFSSILKTMAPKLADRPAGPLAVFKFGGGRGTASNLGDYLADRVGAQLLSLSKRQVVTREQTSELGPPSQSRMAELVERYKAAVAVTGNYTVLNNNEVSVTVFFRDPATFIAFAGESATLPRTAAIDALIGGDADADRGDASPPARRSRANPPPVFRPDPSEAPTKPAAPQLQRGTEVTVRLIEAIYSDHARPGQMFKASLDQDVVEGGRLVAASHADALVEIVNWNGRQLGLALRSIRLPDGTDMQVMTSTAYQQAKATKGGRAKSGLKWGAIGAAIGAVAGGAAGAAVGAGAGAGAGSTIDPGKKEISLASETKLSFRVE